MPSSAPRDLPESRPPENASRQAQAPRSGEESFKRWLAVMISFVALLVALTTLLQYDAAGRNARFNRDAQQYAVNSSTSATIGQQKYLFGTYVAARQYEELRSQAERLDQSGAVAAAAAYITASESLTALTPLLLPPYASVRASDGYRIPDYGRYESDAWVVTATWQSQRREAALQESGAWDAKASSYIAVITVYAVVLFLLGLSATVSGFVRGLLVVVGAGLTTAATIGNIANFASPVETVPPAAIEQYAQGYGLAWQGRYSEALRAYDAAVSAAPEYAAAYAERGSAYLNMKPPRIDLAIRDYRSALARGPQRYEDSWNLGWALYMAGDYAESIQLSKQAAASNDSACGPMFNIAIATLAQGNADTAAKAYADAIAYCAGIALAPPDKGLSAPVSTWIMVQAAVDDIDNLLCQTHGAHCYAGRDQPDVRNVRSRDAVLALGEKYRQIVKEALVRMEYYPGKTVALSGARAEAIRFGHEALDETGKYRSYVERGEFPNDARTIYAMFNYQGLSSDVQTVWKVFHDGVDSFGLRYSEPWKLAKDGGVIKSVTQRYGLQNGRYDVEFYANGELLATGAFTLAEAADLETPRPPDARPSAPVSVGSLVFADDFVNNGHGWWTGQVEQTRVGRIASGEYRLRSNLPDDVWRVTCDDCAGPDNLYYESNTRFIGGPTDWGYGLTVRGNTATNRLYAFLINGNGLYSIWKVADGSAAKLADWTKHAAIAAAGQNRLGVLARGSTLEFYANGQLLKRVTDAALSKGNFGLTVEHNDVEVAFSQVRVWGAR